MVRCLSGGLDLLFAILMLQLMLSAVAFPVHPLQSTVVLLRIALNFLTSRSTWKANQLEAPAQGWVLKICVLRPP